MEESNSQSDIFGTNNQEAPSQKPRWPSLSPIPSEKTLSTASTIQPGQKNPEQLITPTTWSQNRKTAENYAKCRVGKYAQYFEKDRILPIPDLSILRQIRLENQEIGWAKERNLRGALKDRRIPMSVLNQAKFRHVGRPAALGGSS